MSAPKHFLPMLASPLKAGTLPTFPVLASPKLDGIRAHAFDQIYSRKLKLIPNQFTQDILREIADSGLDGELIVGPPTHEDTYRRTMSAVMSVSGEPEDLVFWVFDRFSTAHPFDERYAMAKRLVKALSVRTRKHVKILEHKLINNAEELAAFEQECLDQGYEGAMTRSVKGPYKCGRATPKEQYLLKVKRFCDSEAEIMACLEMEHNENEATINELGRTKRSSHKAGRVASGVLGALRVTDVKSGVVFQVGSGFNDAEKKELWEKRDELIGKIIKYSYFPTGNKEKPRFPVFLGFRSEID